MFFSNDSFGLSASTKKESRIKTNFLYRFTFLCFLVLDFILDERAGADGAQEEDAKQH